jgi:probable rRNA maturation factor
VIAMSLFVSVATEGVRIPLARSRVAEIARAALRAERVRDAMVSIAFVSSAAISKLNKTYLGHTGATDVISFSFGDPLVGDIYISPDIARRNARNFGVGVREEIARLVIHGVLHVTGRDHPEGTSSPMWKRQERLVKRVLTA